MPLTTSTLLMLSPFATPTVSVPQEPRESAAAPQERLGWHGGGYERSTVVSADIRRLSTCRQRVREEWIGAGQTAGDPVGTEPDERRPLVKVLAGLLGDRVRMSRVTAPVCVRDDRPW